LNADLLQGFYLGDLLVEPPKGKITGRAGTAHLPPQAMEVLLSLAACPGELVTREALLQEVWGTDHGKTEALSHAISEIRHALNDHREDPEFIQTLPKRGYRLLVSPVLAATDTATIVFGAKGGVSTAELGLFENLKQRGVLETALAYLILGWLLIQIADIVFGQLLLPQWAGTFVTVFVIAGFPIAILLSWFLEFRDGRAVVHELSPADARKRRFGRTYISVITALGIAAIAVFFYDKSVGLPEAEAPVVIAAERATFLPPVLENSIAVLPFFNIDGSDDTRIFANGLVDDVITRLSRVPGLLVSARGDAYTLEPNSASQKVRDRLRVAMYLEGSVQMLGDEIRVIVQLIDSETGFHVLSRTFDRQRDDFFDVRDEVTELTVANVRVALPPDTQEVSKVDSDEPSLDAYILFRRGVEAFQSPSTESISVALDWFDSALAIDPEYAAAHAGKCAVYAHRYSDVVDPSFIDKAQSSCATALELNPNLDVVYAAMGELYQTTGKYDDAVRAYMQALQTNPSNVEALTGIGIVYSLQQKPDEAERYLRSATGLHPGDWSAYNELGNFLFNSGRYLAAAEQYEAVVALDRGNDVGFANLGTAYMLAGDFAAAAPAMQKAIAIEERPTTFSNLGIMLYYLADFEGAIAAYRRTTHLAPNYHLGWSNLGDALWAFDQPAAAADAFATAEALASEALLVNPNDPGVLMDLAWIKAMLDQRDDASTLIEKALSLAPGDPYAHYIDGLIHARNQDMGAALAALGTAVRGGYSIEMLAAEPHLAVLQDHPGFQKVLNAGNSP